MPRVLEVRLAERHGGGSKRRRQIRQETRRARVVRKEHRRERVKLDLQLDRLREQVRIERDALLQGRNGVERHLEVDIRRECRACKSSTREDRGTGKVKHRLLLTIRLGVRERINEHLITRKIVETGPADPETNLADHCLSPPLGKRPVRVERGTLCRKSQSKNNVGQTLIRVEENGRGRTRSERREGNNIPIVLDRREALERRVLLAGVELILALARRNCVLGGFDNFCLHLVFMYFNGGNFSRQQTRRLISHVSNKCQCSMEHTFRRLSATRVRHTSPRRR